MNYISPRTWELIEILDKALLRLNLKTHSSSKLRKSVAEKEELEDFIGKAWDLFRKNVKGRSRERNSSDKIHSSYKTFHAKTQHRLYKRNHGRSGELSDLTTDDENDHQSS